MSRESLESLKSLESLEYFADEEDDSLGEEDDFE